MIDKNKIQVKVEKVESRPTNDLKTTLLGNSDSLVKKNVSS